MYAIHKNGAIRLFIDAEYSQVEANIGMGESAVACTVCGAPSEFEVVAGQVVRRVETPQQLAQKATMQRNQLLAASDWTQLPDVPLETKEAWATYRQALRDITDQPGYPLDIAWPTPPA